MTSSEFAALVNECEAILRSRAPVDTGNLKYNAIKLEMFNDKTARLYVDEKVAPYMKYTNEPWEKKLIRMGNFKPGGTVVRLRTWRNPNELWFDRAVQEIAEHIAKKLKGELRS